MSFTRGGQAHSFGGWGGGVKLGEEEADLPEKNHFAESSYFNWGGGGRDTPFLKLLKLSA